MSSVVVPQNMIIIWSGTHASIPSGFSRATELDGKFIKGAGSGQNGGGTGGSNTHSHTGASAHTHSVSGTHTHTISLSWLGGSKDDRTGVDTLADHNHGSFTSAAATGGSLSSETANYLSADNQPPYREVIFIKSDGTKAIPNLGIVLTALSSLPSGFYACDGNNSTPGYNFLFLKGASTSADAGSYGGSYNHDHELDHTHTAATHTHGNVTSNATGGAQPCDSWGGSANGYIPWSYRTHTHTVSLAAASDSVSSSNPTVSCDEEVQPAFSRILPMQNRTGSNTLPIGTIGIWVGNLADIPDGWEVYTPLRDKFMKCTTSTGSIGETGGSNTHSHSGDTHTHTSLGHSHTVSADDHTSKNFDYSAGHNAGYYDSKYVDEADTHSGSTSTDTVSYNSATTSASSASNEPAYRKAIFLEYKGIEEASTTESVAVSESVYIQPAPQPQGSESVTVTDLATVYPWDPSVAMVVQAWDGVVVADTPTMPKPTDTELSESVVLSEEVHLRILTPSNSSEKPSFSVDY